MLEIYEGTHSKSLEIYLVLISADSTCFGIDCEFGVVKSDGKIVEKAKFMNVPAAGYKRYGFPEWIRKNELFQPSIQLLHKRKFCVSARLELKTTYPPIIFERSSLSYQYERLFNNNKFKDFTIITSDNKNIPVHKSILSIRSPVFETMLGTKMLESKENIVSVGDINYKTMLEFLRFIYCGIVHKIDKIAFELLYAATKYDVPDLLPFCVASLAKNLHVTNVIDVFSHANMHEQDELAQFCVEFASWNYLEIRTLEKKIPHEFLIRIMDDLNMRPMKTLNLEY